MSIDEFRNAIRTLLNEAARSGLSVDDILLVATEEMDCGSDFDGDGEPTRHMTADEQRVMGGALRRSAKPVTRT